MAETIITTDIPVDDGDMYYCGKDDKGNLVVYKSKLKTKKKDGTKY